jgi:PAS domain S-box-containing protein
MQFHLLGPWSAPYLALPTRPVGYLFSALYLLVFIVALYWRRSDVRRLWGKRLLFLASLLLGAALLNNALIVSLPGFESSASFGPGFTGSKLFLLAAVPILLAAPLGVIPAGVVALVGALARGAFVSHRLSHSFEIALFGLVVGYLIQQDYRGRLPAILRQPLVASLLASGLLWPILILSLYVYTTGPSLSAFVRGSSLMTVEVLSSLGESFIAGAVLQALFIFQPRFKPAARKERRAPPYSRSLNRRLLVFFVPMTLTIIVALFYAVNVTAISVAIRQTVIQTARDASNASGRIPFFFQTGQGLITEFAGDEILQSKDATVRQARLNHDMRTFAFFNQLALLDDALHLLNIYPRPPVGDTTLADQERSLVPRALETQAIQVSPVHRTGEGGLIVSFITPVYRSLADEGAVGELYGFLIGRADLANNPMMQGILSDLQWTMGAGAGFIVDDRGRIVAHRDRDRVFALWQPNDQPRRSFRAPRGQAYEEVGADGMRQLVYYLPVEGHPWMVVIVIPYEVILSLATQISTPLLIILSLIGLAACALIPLVTARLTRPIQALALAATQISRGQLEVKVEVEGEDEVGQLGVAFESMRLGLKQRLEELSLLLEIGQAVSASPELEPGLRPILQGAVQTTAAISVRLILLDEAGTTAERAFVKRQIAAAKWETPARLDEASRRVIKTRRPLIITNAPRAVSTVDPALIEAGLGAMVGLPVLAQDHILGLIWIDYPTPRLFSDSEISFLSTLASQAAVVIENARLFGTIESERGRLATILSSTSDAILVTDQANKVLLVNPAAERRFGLEASEVVGQPLPQVVADGQLDKLLTQPIEGQSRKTLTREIALPDGRILYASASPIIDGDGQITGRVAVMRDITHLKQLDDMKSEFVDTVSHDLRSPLTFMRGYTTMIPMVGEVNPKQQEFIENIVKGIEQMTELIDDLLDIGKIEAGVGITMAPCQLNEIIKGVIDSLRGQADIKRLKLETSLPDHLPAVIGDQTLLRQAITNLLDNAIKYTPTGSVTVGVEEKDSQIVISVRDTGLGIAPADQMRLFEKFYRLKRRETVEIKGTGLGLAIVKSIAERHDGRVWVESKLGVGSTFYLALPKKQIAEEG